MMIIYFVTNGLDDQGDTMNKMKADQRMISYFYLEKQRTGFIRDYIESGHGRYIDNDAEKITKMSHKEFFEHLNGLKAKED